MKIRKSLLERMLQTLVDEWGQEEVAQKLANMGPPNHRKPSNFSGSKLGKRVESGDKMTAISQVERVALEREKKELLIQLAGRYDRKEFLPTVADVREFVIMMGKRPTAMKDRREAFRALLRDLLEMSSEQLSLLLNTALHSGPSELGPLSDAIAAVGGRLERKGA